MLEISVNIDELKGTVKEYNDFSDSLSSKVEYSSNIDTNEAVLGAYVSRLTQLAEVIELYKKLLEHDANLISSAIDRYKEMDEKNTVK